MAENKIRLIRWFFDWVTGIAKVQYTLTTGEKIENFDFTKIFPMWNTFDDIQKHCIFTGLKPKLEDVTAVDKDKKFTVLDKWRFMTATWKRLTEEKVWSLKPGGSGERGGVGKINAQIDALDTEKKAALAALPEEVKAIMRANGVII